MTLKITRYFNDILKKQAAISHFNYSIKFDVPKNIASSWKQQISEKFGELFLNDANYIVICKIDQKNKDIENDDEEEKENISNDVINKFKNFLITIFNTDISKNDIKEINNYLFVKITTK